MNLQKLYDMQKELDKRIVKEKELQGHDLLSQKTLALQTEIAELANEWRGFKFWSEDREARTHKLKYVTTDRKGRQTKEYYNPMLEEYVDCLHFILSIGNELGIGSVVIKMVEPIKKKSIVQQFIHLNNCASWVLSERKHPYFSMLADSFLGLGELLGLTPKEIEQAYLEKNKENHDRQERGY